MNDQSVKKINKEGLVVSDKMNKTRVVAVEFWRKLPKYLKYVRLVKRFKAHDGNNEYKVGDRVLIEASRPISKEKKWKIVKKLGEVRSIERFIMRHKVTIKKSL